MYNYKAKVLRVVDGDTFDVIIDLGFGIAYGIKKRPVRLRLYDIDTPETWRPKSDAELEHGERATARVKELIEGKEVIIKSYKLGIYGRYTADVFIPSTGDSLAQILKEEGFEKKESYE
jgi:micrococcal nuclease